MLMVSLIVQESPVELLKQAFGAGSALEDVYWGLFDLLKFTNINVSTILMLDICIGIIYVIAFHALNPQTENNFLIFTGAAIAQSFWFYKQPHDNIILAIPCVALIFVVCYSKDEFTKYIAIGLIALFVFSFYIQGFIQHLLPMLGIEAPVAFGISLGRTVRTIVLMISGILVGLLHKKESIAD